LNPVVLAANAEAARGDVHDLAFDRFLSGLPFISTYAATKASICFCRSLAEVVKPYGVAFARFVRVTESEFHEVAGHPDCGGAEERETAEKVAVSGCRRWRQARAT